MNGQHNSLENLARRVEQGDVQARAALQGALEPHLARIVRRALENGKSSSSLVRKIVATARRLEPAAPQHADAFRVAGVVADNLGKTIVNRLWGATAECGPPSTKVA